MRASSHSGQLPLLANKSKGLFHVYCRFRPVKVKFEKAKFISLLFCFRLALLNNGKEFANHQHIAKALHCDIFFAKPYAAWQKGLIEHNNGLIREYIPKETDFSTVSQEQLNHIQNLLNTRPRKVLNYATPQDYFSTPCTNQNVHF